MMTHKINLTGSYFSLLILILSLAFPVLGQVNEEEFKQQLNGVLVKDSLPGMAVVMVNKKGIVNSQVLGYADIQANKPYTLNTVQPIGSVSKMILAVGLMKAIELGYFNLDTDINQILPFKVVNPFQPDHVITIRELATHTSGIIDNPDIYTNTYRFNLKCPYSEALLKPMASMGYQEKVRDSTLKEFYYNYLFKEGKYYSKAGFVNSTEGRTYAYSNIATALVAYLIEIKSGMSYSEFTFKYIFKPLHMNHSGWFTAKIKESTQAKLYYNSELFFPLYDLLTYPDGGLKTDAVDLSKFLVDMLNGLTGKSVLLKRESFRIMFTPQFSVAHPPKGIRLEKRNKGIFWNLYTDGNIGHDGDDPGVSSYLLFNPSTSLGGLFITNRYMANKESIYDIINKKINVGMP